jgi:phosphatidylserine/phosphatidylglycerophosphate/cardiolipin synthase-like enzyme
MSKFLDHKSLSREIIRLFEEAEEEITIVSPFIKLHPDIKKVLQRKKQDPDFRIKILYGKNESNHNKSLSDVDLAFFKEFQNVGIYYQENLHAKYYANEFKSIISSINLHEYSMNNNIEVGVLLERKLFGFGGDSSQDSEVFDYFDKIIQKSQSIFIKEVKKKKVFLGLLEKNIGTQVIEDNRKTSPQSNSTEIRTEKKIGFCIRTGKEIPFNPKSPFSTEAYKSWSVYKKEDYPEKYCHFSGEPSKGETTMAKPILKKNWSKAMS